MAGSNGNGDDPQLSYFRRKEIAHLEIVEKLREALKLIEEANRCYARGDEAGRLAALTAAQALGLEAEAMKEAEKRKRMA